MHSDTVPDAAAAAIMACAEPAWLWDANERRVRFANTAALEVWGVPRLEPLLAWRFDHAMPAALRLSELVADARRPQTASQEHLLFWTPRGTLRLECACWPIAEAPGIVLVRVTGKAARKAPARPQVDTPGPMINGAAAWPHVSAPATDRSPVGSQRDRLTGAEAETLAEIARRLKARARPSERRSAEAFEPAAKRTGDGAHPPAAGADDGPGATDPERASVRPPQGDGLMTRPRQEDALRQLGHELRTPLTSVIGFAELMRDERLGPLGNEQYRGYARDIADSARHALALIDSFSRSPRIETRATQPDPVRIEPADAALAALRSMEPHAAKAGVTLHYEADAALPAVVSDRRSLRQMLLNLLSNAIRFASRGGIVTLAVRYRPGGGVRFSVADTGPGMAAGQIAAVLASAAEADGPNNPAASTRAGGIGLPLTRQLAAENGASLAIDSTPGRGTIVSIDFPPHTTVAR
jgi:signal transduction histidine kinase